MSLPAANRTPAPVVQVFPYERVAAGQTDELLGTNGGVGDYLSHLTIVPAAANCGSVTLSDGATSFVVFAGGGTTALPSLIPFTVAIGARSVSGAWKITTGTNVSVIAVGDFS